MKFISLIPLKSIIILFFLSNLVCSRKKHTLTKVEPKEISITCQIGKSQSPINIKKRLIKTLDQNKFLEIKYSEIKGKLLFTGHDWKLSLSLQDQKNHEVIYTDIETGIAYTYQLKQFHLHFPSEHRVDGKGYDSEIHFVHELTENPTNYKYERLVIGILANSSSTADPILNDLVLDGNTSIAGFNNFVAGSKYFHYRGSLTTPPCTENVNWFVLFNNKELKISSKMVNLAHEVLKNKLGHHGNNRELQDQHVRTIWKVGKFNKRRRSIK